MKAMIAACEKLGIAIPGDLQPTIDDFGTGSIEEKCEPFKLASEHPSKCDIVLICDPVLVCACSQVEPAARCPDQNDLGFSDNEGSVQASQ